MARTKATKITVPTTCEMGCTVEDLELIFSPAEMKKFYKWMAGQTMSLCQGRLYNHDTKSYEQACGGVAHGPIVYKWDVERYLAGMPIID